MIGMRSLISVASLIVMAQVVVAGQKVVQLCLLDALTEWQTRPDCVRTKSSLSLQSICFCVNIGLCDKRMIHLMKGCLVPVTWRCEIPQVHLIVEYAYQT